MDGWMYIWMDVYRQVLHNQEEASVKRKTDQS